ncbi:anti-sigma-E factor RseA [Symbiopectobacterium purcellii]|uniref:anti-sigma-E factor RseA n=1 Tax=Symbiopectobacterium purcellii TaxID=2871826 RepID=UPI003F857483
MQKEKLSALMDGEAADTELLNTLGRDAELQKSWQSYHLIRDTLRGDVAQSVIEIDIAARVAQAIPEAQPHPDTCSRLSFWDKVRPWASQLTQVGVAACVSLAVIVGVQMQRSPDQAPEAQNDMPAFSTLPAMGTASPVSLVVPSENVVSHGGQRQVGAQRNRINVMLQDYELQRRLHSEPLQGQQYEEQQAAIQVPGTQSLGTQSR